MLSGPIPARAGQPWRRSPARARRSAYPRSRGATWLLVHLLAAFGGLSPLARGNPSVSSMGGCARGPIPARAGQPATSQPHARTVGAYPRSRGATCQCSHLHVASGGLSPLARGNLTRIAGSSISKGPIPARAGQPCLCCNSCSLGGAYPRSRGATVARHNVLDLAAGLSPLARGNRLGAGPGRAARGPIPARAGQPDGRHKWPLPSRAYPRSRGATFPASYYTDDGEGLSPLARGNPTINSRSVIHGGPIPARAGQPTTAAPAASASRAYPRSRGATEHNMDYMHPTMGLSPLARGNRLAAPVEVLRLGPIPARAGQPRPRSRTAQTTWAYPRSRGATFLKHCKTGLLAGLSPLARGNQDLPSAKWSAGGPIPARAGQPGLWPKALPLKKAYPRSRGATNGCCWYMSELRGLSPLARGNLSHLTCCRAREILKMDAKF